MPTDRTDGSDAVPRNPLYAHTRAPHGKFRQNLSDPSVPSKKGTVTMTSTILALDLGTTTGWALRTRDGAVTSGTQSFRPQRFEGGGMRFLRFKRWLVDAERKLSSF